MDSVNSCPAYPLQKKHVSSNCMVMCRHSIAARMRKQSVSTTGTNTQPTNTLFAASHIRLLAPPMFSVMAQANHSTSRPAAMPVMLSQGEHDMKLKGLAASVKQVESMQQIINDKIDDLYDEPPQHEEKDIFYNDVYMQLDEALEALKEIESMKLEHYL